MPGQKKYYYNIDLPVFSVLGHKDKVYFSGGGGGEKYGVKNKIITYKRGMPANKLTEIINEQITGKDIIERMTINRKNEIVSAFSDNFAVFFKLDDEKGALKELSRVQADFSSEPSTQCLNDVKINDDCSLALTGGEDGVLRIWDLQYDSNNQKLKLNKKAEIVSHTAPISSVDFHLTQPIIASGSDDGSVRIFNIETRQLIKKLVLGNKEQRVAGIYFSFDEKFLYSISNQKKGSSFFTKWDVESNSVAPIGSIKVNQEPISSSNISKEGLFIGLGGCDGSLKIVNLRHMSLEAQQRNMDMIVKGVDFTSDSRFLVGGTPESNFDVLQNLRPEGFMSKFFKMVILGLILAYFYLLISEYIFS